MSICLSFQSLYGGHGGWEGCRRGKCGIAKKRRGRQLGSKLMILLEQLQKINSPPEAVQSEFDALKDHLDSYASSSVPAAPPRSQRKPTSHISHLTQMAAKVLHRDVPGMGRPLGTRIAEKEKVPWDDLAEYQADGSWRDVGLERGMKEVEVLRAIGSSGAGGKARMEQRWSQSWDGERIVK